VDVGAGQATAELVAAVQLDLGAETGERVNVGIEPAAADHIASGRRHARPANPCEQRAGNQERRANPAGELRVDFVVTISAAWQPHRVIARPFDLDPEVPQQLEHRVERRGCAGRWSASPAPA